MSNRKILSVAGLVAAALALSTGAGTAQAAPVADVHQQHHSAHGMGLDLKAVAAHKAETAKHYSARSEVNAASVPSSYSLMNYTVSPGDQGQVGSCVTWATGYSAYGILNNEHNTGVNPMAPMFIYSQIVKDYDNGQDNGTDASIALPMEQKQGIDTQDDYYQGTTDYRTQPTQAERNNAAKYKLSGSKNLLASGNVVTNIKAAISSGKPVPIGFTVRSSFEDLNSSNYNYNPSSSEQSIGGHEVTIVAYDEDGVTIENSWGTNWGNGGFFTAPWSFITGGDVDEVNSMG